MRKRENAVSFGSFFSFLWTEVSLYQQHINWESRLTSIWLFQTGTSSNKDYFFKDEFFLTCHKKYLYESFPTQIKQISQQFRLYVTDTHSRKHGFIFWVVIISKAMEIKTPLKHPFTNHLTTEGLTRTEIFGLNVSGGGNENSQRTATTTQNNPSNCKILYLYIYMIDTTSLRQCESWCICRHHR